MQLHYGLSGDIETIVVPWLGMQILWQRTASFLALWEIRCADPAKRRCRLLVQKLEQMARAAPLLLWPDPG